MAIKLSYFMKRELVYGLVMLIHKGGAKKYIKLTDYEEAAMQRLERRKLVIKRIIQIRPYSSISPTTRNEYKLTNKGRITATNVISNLQAWHI